MKKYLFILILAIVPCTPASANMPNLPPSATIILDCAFNSITCSGAVTNFYVAGSIISNASAPESPPNVYRYERCASCVVGGTQLDLNFSEASELYIGLAMRSSPNFPGYTVNTNKIVMPGNLEGNFIFGLYGTQGGPHSLHFNNQNSGTLNNCHYASSFLAGGAVANGPTVYGDCPGGLNWFANVGNAGWSHGPWHYAEWCSKSSTSRTSRDGIYKWFLDGSMVGNYPQANSGSPYTRVSITPAWDGGGTPWGIDAWYDMDRWVVARLPAGGCAAMGGGSVPAPIDNPVGAPGTTTVTVTVQ